MKKDPLLVIKGLTPLLSLIAVIFLQQNYLKSAETEDRIDYAREEDVIKFSLDVQRKLPSFGFNNLIADWTYLKYIQYHGDREARAVTGYPLIPDFFENIIDSDPRFVEAALNLSTANSLFAGRPEKTVNLMDKVLQTITPETSPLAYYVWIYKGIDQILFLGDVKAAQQSYEMASQWAKESGSLDMAAQTSATAKFLATNPDSRKAQLSAWMMVLSTATDQSTKELVLEKVKKLGANIIVVAPGQFKIEIPPNS